MSARSNVNRLFLLAVGLIGLGAFAPAARADSFVSGTYTQTCYTYYLQVCGTVQGSVPQTSSYSYSHTSDGTTGTTNPGAVFTSAHSVLTFDATPGEYHGLAEGDVQVENNTGASLADAVVGASATVDVSGTDTIHFASGILTAGTAVDFTVTEVLDSSILGSCGENGGPTGTPDDPSAAFAFFQVTGLTALSHNSCGTGSDHMTATATLHSTVGGDLQLVSRFYIHAISALGYPDVPFNSLYSVNHSSDASDTGAIFITVLTQGVTLTSDSGAAYTTAPELGSIQLLCAGIALLGIARQRQKFRRPAFLVSPGKNR